MCKACESKTKDNKPVKLEPRECAVCVGMDGDHTIKDCYYCYACNEWICTVCETKWMNRGIVALRKLFTFS